MLRVHVASLRSPRRGQAPRRSGSGVRGEGWEVTRPMALKRMAKDGQESTVHALAERRALLLAADCPFIVTLLSCFQTKLAFYLLMELAEGGSLTDTLKAVGRFPEANVRFYGAQLLMALSFLHDKDILHRDLKVDNVLLDAAGYIRLCDFGLSMDHFADRDQVSSPCGTLFYVAPEVLRGEPYSKTADWWSYGVLLFYLATGTLPFSGESIQSLYIAVTRKEPCYPSFLSLDVIAFIRKMLVKSPQRRPGQWAEERQTLKNDAFFSSMDWSALWLRDLVPPELPKHYLLPPSQSNWTSATPTPLLSATFPLDLGDLTPAQRDRQSKQTRSRSLDPTGL
ncbi:protein kinase C beta type-like [Babylonia areolata]|uniref:protein kinase C beta type-like n=1 Tax=Babylonia areolata TaxID=304850 RepID=UPI003FCF2D75